MNAAELLLKGRPEALALLEGEQRVSYGVLRQRVMQAAAVWHGRGIGAGDLCIIALVDGVDMVVALLGALWIGAIPAPISPRTEARQIAELLIDSSAKALLAEDGLAECVAGTCAFKLSSWHSAMEAQSGALVPALEAGADAAAFMLYSSGTTGKPKGIIHAQRCVEHAHVFAQEVLGATAADRFFSTSKLFFAYPLANSLFAGLRLGASVVLDSAWPNPQRVAAQVQQYLPTLLFSVPTLYQRLLDADISVPSIRRGVSAGEACSPSLAAAWEQRHGMLLVNGYGTTETLSLMLYKTSAMKGLRPTPLTRVREESNDPNDPEASMRLWFSHPAVALGYSRVVSHDSAQFGPDEFSPGDMFRRLEDGDGSRWSFAGRADQLLKVYGRWVDTVALEQWLFDKLKAEINELSIVPVDEAGSTISLHLFVVAKPGGTEPLLPRVLAKCEQLPAYQRPAQTHILEELPRTETGKIRRGALKSMC